MLTAIEFAIMALQYLPGAIAKGMDIAQHVSQSVDALKREGGPTAEDWAALNARNDALMAQLDAQVARDEADGA